VVTYHDPCHLRRKLGIFKEPRDLLKSTPGLEYVEMKDANRCCGQGGSFNLAAGESVGGSGKDALLAYIIGVEVETKIGLAINKVHYNLGWHPTATLGTLGAAAACCKIMCTKGWTTG
jgi:hypothetical protein